MRTAQQPALGVNPRQTRANPLHEEFKHTQVAFSNTKTRYNAANNPISAARKYFRASACLRILYHLAPVVHPANSAKAKRHHQHNPDKAVGPVEPQQGGHGNRHQDQHPPHGGCAALGQMALQAIATNRLTNFESRETTDHCRPRQESDEQSGQCRHHRTKGDVLKHPEIAELGREPLQPLRQCQQHGWASRV